MKGSYKVRLENKFVSFNITINRKYTILTGESGTGKTKFAKMSELQGITGVVDMSDISVRNIASEGRNWMYALEHESGIAYVVDEHFVGLYDKRIAKFLNESDNYFIIISRRLITTLAYSYTDIYYLRTNNKKNTYPVEIYTEHVYGGAPVKFNPSYIITEGEGSDKQFFSHMCSCTVKGAGSNSKVKNAIRNLPDIVGDVCVIVDGAAFGAFIGITLSEIKESSNNIILYLPESFEYLLLKAGALNPDVDWLQRTYDFCCKEFFLKEFSKVSESLFITWEQFYTELIVRLGERRNREEKDRTGVSTTAYAYDKSVGELEGYFLSFTRQVKSLLEELG